MAYQILARKYRPRQFEEVVAQEHVTRTLQNAIKSDRVSSGYLFCGPRGTGKTTTARILASALNCAEGPTATPCGTCDACLEVGTPGSLDVIEIDAASNTGVDDIRNLREKIIVAPARRKKKIYIVDEVHRLSGAAFDALLKTLEEPPPHAIFILATTEPSKVPETILSRTQRFDFKRVASTALTKHLRTVAEKEKLLINDASLAMLARKADGSVRDSLSLLDQVAAFAGNKISSEAIVEALGLVDSQSLFDFCEAVAAQDSKLVLKTIRQISDSGVVAKDFLNELLDHFRILMILATDSEAGSLLSLTPDETQQYAEQAKSFPVGDTVRLIKITAGLLEDLRSGLDERLVLEMGAVRMATMESTVRFEEILRYLNSASEGGTDADEDLFGQSTKKKADRFTIVRKAEAEEPSDSPTLGRRQPVLNMPKIRAGWGEFLAELRRKNPMLASQLAMGTLHELRDTDLVIRFGSSARASHQVAQRKENLRLIEAMLTEHFGAKLSATLQSEPAPASSPSDDTRERQAKPDVAGLIRRSPRLQRLMEKVDGEIIGVKEIRDQ